MSTAFDIANARNADESTKLLIFGYVRDINNKMKISNNIPDLICFIIILYCMDEEYFDKPGQHIQISEDKLSMIRSSGIGYNNTTYCKQWIPSVSNMIITWKFKVETYTGTILLGIAGNIDEFQNDDFTDYGNDTAPVYALSNNGVWESTKSDTTKFKSWAFSDNDEMTFILNLKDGNISFQVNNDKKQMIWSNIKMGQEIKYKFAIVLFKEYTKISLIDYGQKLPN